VFVCFVWVSEQTAIIYLYSINWLVCITETESVYCAVRTGCLEAAQVKFSFHCHVNAVMTGNSNCQYSASTCVGKRQGFPSFICRTAGCKSVCMRKVLRPTDQLDTGFLASSVLQMPWRCQRFQVATEWFLCSLRNLNLSRWASLKYTNYCCKFRVLALIRNQNLAALIVSHCC